MSLSAAKFAYLAKIWTDATPQKMDQLRTAIAGRDAEARLSALRETARIARATAWPDRVAQAVEFRDYAELSAERARLGNALRSLKFRARRRQEGLVSVSGFVCPDDYKAVRKCFVKVGE